MRASLAWTVTIVVSAWGRRRAVAPVAGRAAASKVVDGDNGQTAWVVFYGREAPNIPLSLLALQPNATLVWDHCLYTRGTLVLSPQPHTHKPGTPKADFELTIFVSAKAGLRHASRHSVADGRSRALSHLALLNRPARLVDHGQRRLAHGPRPYLFSSKSNQVPSRTILRERLGPQKTPTFIQNRTGLNIIWSPLPGANRHL